MNKNLLENGYEVVRNFITTDQADIIHSSLVEEARKRNCKGDSQVPNADSIYNSIEGIKLLVNKNQEVSDIIDESVIPTYCYARIYKNGCDLKKHTDRPECEISLSIHLNGDEQWEFYIENVDNEENSVILNKGDAILYLGQERPHWRNTYNGELYSQIFLHYVRSNGNNKERYFDNSNRKSYDDIGNYIYHESNFLDHDFCDKLINEFDDSEWIPTIISGGKKIDTDVRNCTSVEFSWKDVMDKNYNTRKELDEYIFNKVSEAYKTYKKVCHRSQLTCIEDEGYTLLKYTPGGKYIQHTDHFKETPRSLTIIINLNDDYTGGELAFRDRSKVFSLKKGDLIIFPSNFMYPHEIIPVESGTRYSLITWMV